MGNENYMRPFVKQHELAFDNIGNNGSAEHGLHNDNGLPEEANGLGWYSQNRLSYGEWHRLSCARLAFNELAENTPLRVYQLLIGSLSFPWLALGAGIVHLIASMKRASALRLDNGIQVAKKSLFCKLKCGSAMVLRALAFASIVKMAFDNYEIKIEDIIG